MIETKLIHKAEYAEAKVSYHKIIGDSFRYICEYATGAARKNACEKAHAAYKDGTQIAHS